MQMIAILSLDIHIVSALLIAAAHWFPWPMVFGRKLRQLEAHAGTLAICTSNRRNPGGHQPNRCNRYVVVFLAVTGRRRRRNVGSLGH